MVEILQLSAFRISPMRSTCFTHFIIILLIILIICGKCTNYKVVRYKTKQNIERRKRLLIIIQKLNDVFKWCGFKIIEILVVIRDEDLTEKNTVFICQSLLYYSYWTFFEERIFFVKRHRIKQIVFKIRAENLFSKQGCFFPKYPCPLLHFFAAS